MATTQTFNFDPFLADVIEESYERIGKLPRELNADHIRSAIRSMNLMLIEHAAYLQPQIGIVQVVTDPMAGGEDFFELPDQAMDVINMQIKRDDVDTPMTRMSRDDYREQSRKQITGRPFQYFQEIAKPLRIYTWLKPSAGDVFVYDYISRPQDVGGITNTLEQTPQWYEAIHATLAEKLAEKWAPERLAEKIQLGKKARLRAKSQERAGGDVRFIR